MESTMTFNDEEARGPECRIEAPGLTGDWLNGWLAAVGATVLVPGLRLAWSTQDPPWAVLVHDSEGIDVAQRLAESLPTLERLDRSVTAGLPQNLTLEQYRAAAERSRQDHDPGLSLLTTDATTDAISENTLANSPFNVGAPRGETLFTRLRKCRELLGEGDQVVDAVRATLEGRGRRHKANGLGFDYRRMPWSVPSEGDKWVDPVVECLCYYGLRLHPVHAANDQPMQRGWWGAPYHPCTFCWPVWTEPLDRWAVDAVLDLVYRDVSRRIQPKEADAVVRVPTRWRLHSVSGLYGSVPFEKLAQMDQTRGYGSVRLA